MADSIIPQNYQQWRHCIIVDCGLELTPDYISERLSALKNDKDQHTQKFVKLYGKQHLANVIGWFTQAESNA